MKNNYDQIFKIFPKNSDEFLSQCIKKCISFNEKIITRQRILTLLPMVIMKKTPLPRSFPQNRFQFFSHISKPIDTENNYFSPQASQYVTKLYEFLLSSVSDLIKISIRSYKTLNPEDFNFFSFSTIPSIFGYFSSLEHIDNAMHFYCALVSSCPRVVTLKLITPFFNNATTYRFMETLMSDFFQNFCTDIRFFTAANKKVIMKNYIPLFFDSLSKNLPLLPSQHLTLLRLMPQNQFTDQEIFSWFINHFIATQCHVLLRSSLYSCHSSIIRNFFQIILESFTPEQIRFLYQTKSSNEIPSSFSNFGHSYITVISTVCDISILSQIAKETPGVTLPKFITLLESPSFYQTLNYNPALIKIYPKHLILKNYRTFFQESVFFPKIEIPSHYEIPKFRRRFGVMKAQPLNLDTSIISSYFQDETERDLTGCCNECNRNEGMFFCEKCQNLIEKRKPITFKEYIEHENYIKLCENAKLFESFIDSNYLLHVLGDWKANVRHAFKSVSFAFAQSIIEDNLRTRPTKIINGVSFPDTLLFDGMNIFDQKCAHQFYYTKRASCILDESIPIINEHKKIQYLKGQLAQLENNWKTLLSNLRQIRIHDIVNPEKELSIGKEQLLSTKLLFLCAFLNLLSFCPFSKRYFRIIQIMNEIQAYFEPFGIAKPALYFIVSLCRESGFITTFVEISALLVKRPEFVDLCDTREKSLWYEIEKEVMKVLQLSPNTLDLYDRIHDLLLTF